MGARRTCQSCGQFGQGIAKAGAGRCQERRLTCKFVFDGLDAEEVRVGAQRVSWPRAVEAA